LTRFSFCAKVRTQMALPLDTLQARAAGDAQLARFGLDLDCALLVGDGDTDWLVEIARGEVVRVTRGPLIMPKTDLRLRAAVAPALASGERAHGDELPLPERDRDELAFDPDPASSVDVERALRELPDDSREALLMQVLGGFSCAEISTALGTTEGAVMTRLTRARQAMRRRINPSDAKQAKRA